MTDPTTPQTDPAVTSLTAKAGDKVDNYTIMEQIGAGGTAIVFRGHDHVLNRHVAIKQLVVPPGDAGDDIRERARAEAEMHKAAAGSDPNLLVQYIDTIDDPRGLFLISEYVDGPSLEWILQQETGPMDQRQALGIIAATAKALNALHTGGMVHRDLKPSNILMPREGGLKLADFGLAAIIAEQQSLDLGSVRYMAPEVLQGQTATPKSDLYALGIVAYEMLAGRDHFNDAFRTILRDQRNQAMRWVKWHTNARAKVTPLNQLVEGLPESLAQVVARMMEKDPARRVGSAKELIDAIRNHFASGGQAEQPSPHAAMAPPKIEDVSQTAAVPQKSKLPIILAATLVIWVAAIGGFFVWKNQQDKNEQAKRTAALVADIEDANLLIDKQQDYPAAIAAFAQVLIDHEKEFNPDARGFRDDLVEAGRLKAEALLAADSDDFVTALGKAQAYQKNMNRWASQPQGAPSTSLSLSNAEKLVDAYTTRAARQQEAEEIAQMLDEGKLAQAIQAIRLAEQGINANTAAEDIAQLKALERRYHEELDGARIADMLAQARELRDAGELRDAIRLLEEEVEDAGENVPESVTALLTDLNKLQRIKTVQLQIDRAREQNDPARLVTALNDMLELQPTEALRTEINQLEVAMMIEEAEQAIQDNKVQTAQQVLAQIKERDPDNPQAERLRQMIANAESMQAAEKRGDQALATGNYTDAINQYRIALKYGHGHQTARINSTRSRTRPYRVRLEESADRPRSGAMSTLAQEPARPWRKTAHGDTDAIARTQQSRRSMTCVTYTLLAHRRRRAGSPRSGFGRAKVKYLEAAENL